MLVVARAHSKQELEKKVQEGRKGRESGGSADQKVPELSVEVMGTALPTISYEDELKVYCNNDIIDMICCETSNNRQTL